MKTPGFHRLEDRTKGEAFFGEFIGQMLGAVARRDLADDTGLEQTFEAVTEHVRRDALRRFDEFLESGTAENEIADDEEGPAIAEEIEAARDRAG